MVRLGGKQDVEVSNHFHHRCIPDDQDDKVFGVINEMRGSFESVRNQVNGLHLFTFHHWEEILYI